MSASTTSSDLPPDVIADILSRLPVKSIIRFRCVTKSFCSLSKDPDFISKHLHRSLSNDSHILVQTHENIESDNSFSLLNSESLDLAVVLGVPLPGFGVSVVIGSCNGLVCLLWDRGPSFLLWNPAIREVKILPEPQIPLPFRISDFDTIYNSVGFGFHRDEYKVVRIVGFGRSQLDPDRVELYTVSSGCWREIDATVPCKIYNLSCSVIIKGTPYWIGYGLGDDVKCIVSFDMADEKFEIIDLPETDYDNTCSLGMFKEQLAVYFYRDFYADEEESCTEIWVMHGESGEDRWTKLFTVRGLPIPGGPVGFYGNGVLLWQKFQGSLWSEETSPRDFIAYSVITNERKSIEYVKDHEHTKAYAHVESLVWINERSEDQREVGLV